MYRKLLEVTGGTGIRNVRSARILGFPEFITGSPLEPSKPGQCMGRTEVPDLRPITSEPGLALQFFHVNSGHPCGLPLYVLPVLRPPTSA